MIRINLAPPSTKKARPSSRAPPASTSGWCSACFFIALIALLGGYWWKLSSDIAWLNGEIAQAEAEKPASRRSSTRGSATAGKEELESRVNAIERIAATRRDRPT